MTPGYMTVHTIDPQRREREIVSLRVYNNTYSAAARSVPINDVANFTMFNLDGSC